jgi:predicted nuclease with TOPRIM domain
MSIKPYKNFKPQFKKTTPLQRLKKTKAYFERRLRRLSKRANWLKRKKKRLKTYLKSRRSSIYLDRVKQSFKIAVNNIKVKKLKLHKHKLHESLVTAVWPSLSCKPNFVKTMVPSLLNKKFSYFK